VPDFGIVSLFFMALFYCLRRKGVADEKTCPHEGEGQDFSGGGGSDPLLTLLWRGLPVSPISLQPNWLLERRGVSDRDGVADAPSRKDNRMPQHADVC